jgi:hypothetical protein
MRSCNPQIIVVCPHCGGTIDVESVNCAIFRHGIFKRNGHQVPPHARKADCDAWIAREEIHGCGRPFRINQQRDISGNMVWVAAVCDYI